MEILSHPSHRNDHSQKEDEQLHPCLREVSLVEQQPREIRSNSV
jgi:hypothetical protein